ncbi:MAG: di-heme oxidoredictase family protein [Bacteroidota bacterium]
MRHLRSGLQFLFILPVAVLLSACNHDPVSSPEAENENELLAGGRNTVFTTGFRAFGSGFPDMGGNRASLHEIGDGAFAATFVTAPAILNPGLGPVYNNISCGNCHVGDGRGHAPDEGGKLESMLFRISVPGSDAHGGPAAVPGFGGQLQDKAVYGIQPEAGVSLQWIEEVKNFVDGGSQAVRKPVYTITDPYRTWPGNAMLSARVAPPVHGLGMLEAIPEADIMKYADPADANGDGISGKANSVWNEHEQRMSIGRFGWKSEAPTLLQQVAGAYSEDMGITSFIFPYDSRWSDSQKTISGHEISDSLLYATTFYCRSLAVPARRNVSNPDVLQGKVLFKEAGCDGCHVPKFRTGVDVSFPEISSQVIFPYTDMLLHDMGDDLSDNRPTYLATGNEWRTPPLWGIGLTKVVNGRNNFLHDGRARSLMEAVLWHGGEGTTAREKVQNMKASDRAKLVKFLESL